VTRLSSSHPVVQLLILLIMYVFHLTVLTQNQVVFPFQLWPNNNGWFQSIGFDSLAGIISLAIALRSGKRGKGQQIGKGELIDKEGGSSNGSTRGRSILAAPDNFDGSAPWMFPKNRLKNNSTTTSMNQWERRSPRLTSAVTFFMLVYAYFSTGQISFRAERILFALAGKGVPLTIAMHRSLVVLLGHLAWVAVGSFILWAVPTPRPFFGGWKGNGEKSGVMNKEGNETPVLSSSSSSEVRPYHWYNLRWNDKWLWPTVGGYFISAWFFNIADFINQLVLPVEVFQMAGEGVVAQLINPENNDIAASLVGYIAPCISAPWWEEVLYRGFLLPALCIQMKFWPALFVSGIIFSAHHVSTTGAIPLAILGWTWGMVYAKSNNLLVTILIHCMWNSRVFLGSWLGL